MQCFLYYEIHETYWKTAVTQICFWNPHPTAAMWENMAAQIHPASCTSPGVTGSLFKPSPSLSQPFSQRPCWHWRIWVWNWRKSKPANILKKHLLIWDYPIKMFLSVIVRAGWLNIGYPCSEKGIRQLCCTDCCLWHVFMEHKGLAGKQPTRCSDKFLTRRSICKTNHYCTW